MMGHNDLSIRNKKGVKIKMKTTLSFYGKGNEVIS